MQDLLATIIKISYTPEKTAVAKDIWPLSRKRIYTLMFGMACQKNKHNVIIKCAKDISSFAQAVGQQAKDIDSKVCKDKKKGTADNGPESTNGLQGRWSCQDPKGGGNTATNYDTFSKRFGELEGHGTRVKGDNANKTPTGWPGTENSTHDTANAVADELSKLQRHEQAKVAGLLSKTISGAEVKKGVIRCC